MKRVHRDAISAAIGVLILAGLVALLLSQVNPIR